VAVMVPLPLLNKIITLFPHRFQTVYTEQEIQYFRILVKEIAESDELHIRQMSCVNLTSKIPKLKVNMKILQKTRAEELLTEWTRTGYFLLSDHEIYFGPRMLSEFGNFLKTNFPDNIVACQLCKNVVLAVSDVISLFV
jgi:non-structural maintenance of chromosomes element 1